MMLHKLKEGSRSTIMVMGWKRSGDDGKRACERVTVKLTYSFQQGRSVLDLCWNGAMLKLAVASLQCSGGDVTKQTLNVFLLMHVVERWTLHGGKIA